MITYIHSIKNNYSECLNITKELECTTVSGKIVLCMGKKHLVQAKNRSCMCLDVIDGTL